MSITSKPIGILDSGVGGLTVAKAVADRLPLEEIIYFGDTAHFPYGDKSVEKIQARALKIANFLMEAGCKIILIACHSASAVAFNVVNEAIGEKISVFNMIEPVMSYLASHGAYQTIGLIGTKPTIHSGVYQRKIAALNLGIQLKAFPTPLLAPAIEEGFFEHRIIDDLLEVYLDRTELRQIQALILGCTHYPVIASKISDFYQAKVEIIDAATIVAEQIQSYLQNKQLLNVVDDQQRTFYVSDYTDSFAATAKIFFGKQLNLNHHPLI